MRDTGYAYAWEYLVRPSSVERFKRVYGPEGEWAALFRKAPGYLLTELHRDIRKPLRFITIDYWSSRNEWERFRRDFATAFTTLDSKCKALTTFEKEIGRFEPVGGGHRLTSARADGAAIRKRPNKRHGSARR